MGKDVKATTGKRLDEEALYRRYRAQVEAMMMNRLGRLGSQDVPDLVQDVWIDILIQTRDGEALSTRGVGTIVERNIKRAKRYWAREGRLVSLEWTTGWGEGRLLELQHFSHWGCPEREVEAGYLGAAAHRVIRNTVTPRQYRVLEQRLAHGRCITTSARALRLSPSVVKNDLYRGLRRAGRALQKTMGRHELNASARAQALESLISCFAAAPAAPPCLRPGG